MTAIRSAVAKATDREAHPTEVCEQMTAAMTDMVIDWRDLKGWPKPLARKVADRHNAAVFAARQAWVDAARKVRD